MRKNPTWEQEIFFSTTFWQFTEFGILIQWFLLSMTHDWNGDSFEISVFGEVLYGNYFFFSFKEFLKTWNHKMFPRKWCFGSRVVWIGLRPSVVASHHRSHIAADAWFQSSDPNCQVQGPSSSQSEQRIPISGTRNWLSPMTQLGPTNATLRPSLEHVRRTGQAPSASLLLTKIFLAPFIKW